MANRFLESFAGGSLNTVIHHEDKIIKLYNGSIPRGAEKLIQEYNWLKALPNEIFKNHPLIFPIPLNIKSDLTNNKAEIQISYIPRFSLSKYILDKEITVKQVRSSFNNSLKLLINNVYPISNASIDSYKGYRLYHAQRITLARKYLRQLVYFQPILNSRQIIINGIDCPTINHFLSWLDDNYKSIFISSNQVKIHGNFHFDNILVDKNKKIDQNSISFIDPRGDIFGFPHYDFSKLLTSIESYYDEIHYGLYSLEHNIRGNSYEINIKLNHDFDHLYGVCFKDLEKWVEIFAQEENISLDKFITIMHTVQCIHILSFIFYHAYQQNTSPNRIRAFIAMFSLLSNRLMKMYNQKEYGFIPNKRLVIGESNGY